MLLPVDGGKLHMYIVVLRATTKRSIWNNRYENTIKSHEILKSVQVVHNKAWRNMNEKEKTQTEYK